MRSLQEFVHASAFAILQKNNHSLTKKAENCLEIEKKFGHSIVDLIILLFYDRFLKSSFFSRFSISLIWQAENICPDVKNLTKITFLKVLN